MAPSKQDKAGAERVRRQKAQARRTGMLAREVRVGTPDPPAAQSPVELYAKSRHGARAGRGFRFQDLFAALVVLELWRDGEMTAIVTPEGFDDVAVETSSQSVFIQVKSRREDAGDFSTSTLRKDLQAVARNWSKRVEAGLAATTVLVLELPVSGVPLGEWNGTAGRESLDHSPELAGELQALSVEGSLSRSEFAASLSVATCVGVRDRAVEIVAACRDIPEALAEIVVAAVCGRVGELSDQNTNPDIASCGSLTVGEVDDLVESVLATVDVKLLDEARLLGVCGPIDWDLSHELPALGQGAHVSAAHVAAGLLVARPELTDRVVNVVEARHLAVVSGPSGSGKSSLAFSAVHQIRSAYRWQQIHSLEATGQGGRDSTALVLARIESLRPSRYAPVGVLIDDAGRHDPSSLGRLLHALAGLASVVTVVTVREEDRAAVPALASLSTISPGLDNDFAELLWRDYASRGLTGWAGWHEPMEQSGGHLLEYVSLLTEGERLEAVVGAQVQARELDPSRQLELRILRLAACANQYGVPVAASSVQVALGSDSQEFAAAGRRLVNEHLVVEGLDGLLRPLHELRSAAIARAAHPFGQAATVRQLVGLVPSSELARFLRRALEAGADKPATLAAASERLSNERSLTTLIAVVSAFRADGLETRAEGWKRVLDECGVEPGNAVLALTLSRLPSRPDAERHLVPEVAAAIERLRGLPTDPDLRAVWDALDPALVASLLADTASSEGAHHSLFQAIIVLRGADPRVFEDVADAVGARLSKWPLAACAEMVEALRRVAPTLAVRAVLTAGGEDALLRRVVQETPWLASLERGVDGVDGKWVFIDEAIQTDPNGSVVDVCRLSLALAPTATVARVSAVDVRGVLVRIGRDALVEKRIRRENLPHDLEVSDYRAMARAISRRYGAGTLTAKLAAEAEAITELADLMPEVVSAYLRGRPMSQQLVDRIGDTEKMLRLMDAPVSLPAEDVVPGALGDYPNESPGVTIVREVLAHVIPNLACAANSGRRPLNAVVTLDRLIPKLDEVIEFDRYRYLAAPPDCQILRTSLGHIRLIASAGASGDPKVWQAMRAAAGQNAGQQLVSAAAVVAAERGPTTLQREADRLRAALAGEGWMVSVVPSAPSDEMMNWPPGELAVIVEGEDLVAHVTKVPGVADGVRRARAKVDRRVWIGMRSPRGFLRASIFQVTHGGTLPLGNREPPAAFAVALAPAPVSLVYERAIRLARRLSALTALIAIRGGKSVPDGEDQLFEESWEDFRRVRDHFDELETAHPKSEYVAAINAIIATLSHAISTDLATVVELGNEGESGWDQTARLGALDLLDTDRAHVPGSDASVIYGVAAAIATIEDSFEDADEQVARVLQGAPTQGP